MNVILLIAVMIFVALQNICKKAYNSKILNGAYTFSWLSALVAAVFFAVLAMPDFDFSKAYLVYSVVFAVAYSVALVFSFLAIAEGSLSLTSLIISYSLIIPSLYGLIFLKEKISLFLVIGLILLGISLLLINIEKGEKKHITLKWTIYAALAFIGNGMCSAIQKVQQLNCEGKYKNEFMVVALIISAVVIFILGTVKLKENVLYNIKKGGVLGVICGVSNGIVNLFVLILSNKMPASVMFPIISAGGIITSFLISLLIYKEKLSNEQNIGLVLGIASVVFLSI